MSNYTGKTQQVLNGEIKRGKPNKFLNREIKRGRVFPDGDEYPTGTGMGTIFNIRTGMGWG